MSSFLCFVCHSAVNAATDEEMREKYHEVVGMNLYMDWHLCYICCHMLNKLWMFRSVCIKHSLEYPSLFREKGTLNMQKNDLEIYTICPEDICSNYFQSNTNSKIIYFYHNEEESQKNCSEFENVFLKLYKDINDFNEHTASNENLDESEDNMKDECDLGDNVDFDENFNLDQQENELHDIKENNDSGKEIENLNNVEQELNETMNEINVKKKKFKKNRRKFEKIVLSREQQKAEVEKRRKDKKYLESEFKCYNCALGFLFKDTYQTHMMRHEESNGEYRCQICTLRFASAPGLRAHSAAHRERYVCTKCGSAVLPRGKNTHARKCWRKGSGAACHLCAGMFSDSNGLQQHLKRYHHIQSSNRSYSCSVCGKRCANHAAVRTHMIKHLNRKFHCDRCPSTFSSPYTLARHAKCHDTNVALSQEQFRCEICDVGYSSKKSLLAHKRNTLIHQQTVYICPVCSRISPNQRSLNSHMEAVHSGVKNYMCPQCPAVYSNRKSLVRHIGNHNVKKEVKKVVCHLCGISFKGNNKLNRHLKQVCEKAKNEEEFTNLLYEQDCLNAT